MKKISKLFLGTVLSVLVVPMSAYAVEAVQTPGIQTDIGQAEKPADLKNTDQGAKLEATQEQSFSIGKIKLISEEIKLKDYSKILSKYENRKVTMAELNKLSLELTQKLRNHGYPAATIYVPSQSFTSGGELLLQVIPGRFGKITIENESKLPDDIALGYLKGLKQGDIIRTIPLETAMHKLTQVGGVSVAGLLSPGEAVGTTDLTVKLKKGKLATEILYAENYGTINAGRYRYGLQGNVQFPDHAGALDYAVVFSNANQHFYNLEYSKFVGRSGTKLGLNVSRSDYELAGQFRRLGAKGIAYTIGVNGTTPLYNSWANSMNFHYGYRHRALEDEQSAVDFKTDKESHAVYFGVDGTNRRGKARFDYNVTNTSGKLGLNNEEAKWMYDGAGTEGYFNKTNFSARYLQSFDKHFDLQLKFNGQIASKNLDGSEEIYLGGINGVRAYPTGAASGDEGYFASLELLYHTKVPGLTFSAYLDTGHVKSTHDANNASYGGETATGWGLGVSYVKPGDWFARFDYARRIGYGLSESADESTKAKGRMWFMLGKVF